MHYIAEIVLPPMPEENIHETVEKVMNHFLDGDEEDEDRTCNWWDYWQIGGRFSEHKTLARIGDERIAEFCEELNRRNVTVHGFSAGKQELAPASQIPSVDTLWRERFPGMGEHCILFAHSGNSGDIMTGNYCRVSELPEALDCERLIIAGYSWGEDETEITASDALAKTFWNGVRHQDTDFDGDVKKGIERITREQVEKMREGEQRTAKNEEERLRAANWLIHKQRELITDDWLVVTVDYHN